MGAVKGRSVRAKKSSGGALSSEKEMGKMRQGPVSRELQSRSD